MAAITVPGMFLTGDHASRPAASAVGGGALYSCTDHDLIYQSDTSSWTTWATVGGGGGVDVEDEGTPLSTTATTLDFTGAGVTASGSGATKTINIPGGGGGDDPVEEAFGTPDTAYEFDAALSGWTTMGSPDVSDADSTVPGHYYVKEAANAGTNNVGIYRATGSFPQTFITKVSDFTLTAADYQRTGLLFIGEATPGVFEGIYFVHNGDWTVAHERFTNPTTYSATIGSNLNTKFVPDPVYYGIVVNSSTDVDFWFSFGGRVWRKRTDARNPSITVGSFGIAIDSENASFGSAAAFDYVRVWNSALTFPGF